MLPLVVLWCGPCSLLQDIKALFKQHVLYIVAADITRDMALALGATCDTSADTVLQVLTTWAHSATSSPSSNLDTPHQPPAAAPAAAANTAATAGLKQPSSDAGCFTTTLHDMAQLYHHLSRFLTSSQLPPRGFSVLQDPQHLAALPKDVAVRLRVCKAFSNAPLIWLPDTDALLAAAAEYRAAESRRVYMEEDSLGMPGGFGALDGHGSRPGGSSMGRGAAGRLGSRAGRGAGKAPGRSLGSGLKGQTGTQQGSAAAEPVGEDFMYEGAFLSSLAHTPMRGRFYSPDQLRFTDAAQVLEVTYPTLYQYFHIDNSSSGSAKGGKAAAAAKAAAAKAAAMGAPGDRPPPMLRCLGVYYGQLRDVFVDQLQRFKYDQWIPLVGECAIA